MACVNRIPQFLHFIVYFSVISCCFLGLVSANRELDEDNWKEILEGEWMVEFYAPWCPACNALAGAWRELGTRATRKSLGVRTAAVDVTKSPGLSGRFVVTALPTIYHVKDAQFRQYKGPRDVDSMLAYLEDRRWEKTDPISSWKAPHSIQMSFVAEFFKLSQVLRNVHTMLMETYGLPTWGSYLIFAIATIFIGALLGLVLVCLIDLLYPPRRTDKVFVPASNAGARVDDKDIQEELINDDIVDDDDKTSDAEKNSPPDTSEDEKCEPEGGGDSGERTEVRKRRPRKAD